MTKKGIWILISLVVIMGLLVGVFGCKEPTPTTPTTTTPTATTPTTTAQPIELTWYWELAYGTDNLVDHWWMDEVEARTNGRVHFNRVQGGSLGSIAQTPLLVKDRVTNLGLVTSVYNPAEYALTTVTTLPFLSGDQLAFSLAAYDLMQDPAMQAQYTAQNSLILFNYYSEPMEIVSHVAATTIEELKPLKIRAHGGGADACAAAGLIGVAIPWPDIAQAGETGVIDAAIVPVPSVARDAGLADIFEYALRVPIYYFEYSNVINLDDWNALPSDIQQIMLDLAKEAPRKNYDFFVEAGVGAWADFEAAGVEQVTWSQEELDKFTQIGGEPVQEKWVTDMKAQGLPGQEILDQFHSLISQYGG